MKKCQTLRIVKIMAPMKFTQRLAGSLIVTAANASQSGPSQNSAVRTHSPPLAVTAHSATFFIATGSAYMRIICADMDTAAKIHSTAILDFQRNVSTIGYLLSFSTERLAKCNG
jgi:hypothetical protein